MKEEELRELSKCAVCGKKIGDSFRENHTLPIIWKVTVERFMLDDGALKRQTGLEMMMGGHVGLAQALSPNEDMAQRIMGQTTFCVCEHCAMEPRLCLAAIAMEKET